MNERLRQIMLEYVRLYAPTSHINEDELLFHNNEEQLELVHEISGVSAVYTPSTDEIQVITMEDDTPVVKLSATLQEDLDRFELYVSEIKEMLETA